MVFVCLGWRRRDLCAVSEQQLDKVGWKSTKTGKMGEKNKPKNLGLLSHSHS